MTLLADVLIAVRSGKLNFSPESDSEEALREFQLPARALVYAEEEKLLGHLVAHKNALHGELLYDLIVVVEGMTHRGEMFLAEPESQSQKERQLEEILELRPNFMGLGINIRALWRKFFGK